MTWTAVGVFALAALAFASYTAVTTTPTTADDSISLSPTPFPRPLTWDVEIDPPDPVSGDEVTVTVTVTKEAGPGHGKEPVYELHLEDDGPLTLESSLIISRASLGEPAGWTFTAASPGDATISIDLRYQLTYCFIGTPCGAHAVYATSPEIAVEVDRRLGDADCGDSVNAIDAALVLQLNAGLVDSLPCETSADVNKDGRANALDAALILQYAAGLLPGL